MYVQLEDMVYQQIVGIPMGTAPPIADLLFFVIIGILCLLVPSDC